jgi:hypothetical protein
MRPGKSALLHCQRAVIPFTHEGCVSRGRVNGPKHEAVRDLPAQFLCSDSDNHSEHGWGCAYYEFGSLAEQVQEHCLDQIATADMLFAYLHDPLSYSAITEIAYASAKGKKCVVAIYIAGMPGRS